MPPRSTQPDRRRGPLSEGAARAYAAGRWSIAALAAAEGVSRRSARASLAASVGVRSPGRPAGTTRVADTLTEDVLRREYGDRRRSAAAIAAEAGCSHKAVLTRLRRFGIPVRPAGGRTLPALEALTGEEVARLGPAELARLAGGSEPTARAHLRRMGFERGRPIDRAALADAYVRRGLTT